MRNLSHQVAVCLSLTFVTRDNGKTNYMTFPLAYITKAFVIFWQLWPVIHGIAQIGIVWYKLAQSGFSSLAFALQKTHAENPCGKFGGIPCPV